MIDKQFFKKGKVTIVTSPVSPASLVGPMSPMTDNIGTCLQATRAPIILDNVAIYQDVVGKIQEIDLMPGEAQILMMKYNK